jgi:hypothetical protein
VQLCILLDILTMHLPINVKSPNNISKWQVGFNSAFKGLTMLCLYLRQYILIFLSVSRTALVDLDLLYEIPRYHSDTPHSVRILWTSDKPDAETST